MIFFLVAPTLFFPAEKSPRVVVCDFFSPEIQPARNEIVFRRSARRNQMWSIEYSSRVGRKSIPSRPGRRLVGFHRASAAEQRGRRFQRHASAGAVARGFGEPEPAWSGKGNCKLEHWKSARSAVRWRVLRSGSPVSGCS